MWQYTRVTCLVVGTQNLELGHQLGHQGLDLSDLQNSEFMTLCGQFKNLMSLIPSESVSSLIFNNYDKNYCVPEVCPFQDQK